MHLDQETKFRSTTIGLLSHTRAINGQLTYVTASAVQAGLKGTGDISNACVFRKLNGTAKPLPEELLDFSRGVTKHPAINNFSSTVFADPV